MAEPNNPANPAGGPAPKRVPRRARKKKSVVEARRQREFTYRGLTLPELQALPQDELMLLLPSRVRRFFRKGLDEGEQQFLSKVVAAEAGAEIRTHLRDFPVLPAFVGKVLMIHDGKEFQRTTIAPEMIGHKLGEFALTRKTPAHTGPGVGATRSSKFMPLK